MSISAINMQPKDRVNTPMIQTRHTMLNSPDLGKGETPMRRAFLAARLETSLASSAGSLRTGIQVSQYLIYVESDDFF